MDFHFNSFSMDIPLIFQNCSQFLTFSFFIFMILSNNLKPHNSQYEWCYGICSIDSVFCNRFEHIQSHSVKFSVTCWSENAMKFMVWLKWKQPERHWISNTCNKYKKIHYLWTITRPYVRAKSFRIFSLSFIWRRVLLIFSFSLLGSSFEVFDRKMFDAHVLLAAHLIKTDGKNFH